MPRPLTAADRVPKVGDVLLIEGKASIVNKRTREHLETKQAGVRGMIVTNVKWWGRWVYIWRQDGGSITTEAP